MKTVSPIETANLELYGIRREDAPYIVAWRSDPDNFRYFRQPHALTLEEHLKWFDERYAGDENRCDWLAIRKATSQPIGVFGLVRRGQGVVETNYLLDKTAQGRGYATEAVRALLEYAKTDWNSLSAVAEIHESNYASIRFAERLGFRPESVSGNFIRYGIEL